MTPLPASQPVVQVCLCVYEPLSGGEGNGALSFLFPTPLWILLPSQAQCGNFSMDYIKKKVNIGFQTKTSENNIFHYLRYCADRHKS